MFSVMGRGIENKSLKDSPLHSFTDKIRLEKWKAIYGIQKIRVTV